MRVSKLVLAMALVGGVQQSGCVEDVRFNPSGCDVQVRGQWFVEGENPTAETCQNIALVELAIIDDPVLEFWSAPEFLLRCDAESDSNATVVDGGAFLNTMTVTRNRCGGTGAILKNRPGPYKYRWRAITDLKFIVDCSPIREQPIEEIDGGTQLILDLDPVNFQVADGGVLCPDAGSVAAETAGN